MYFDVLFTASGVLLISIYRVFLTACVTLCAWWVVEAPSCAEFCLYMYTHWLEQLLSPHGPLRHVALCLLVLYSIRKPVWFLQPDICDFLPLRGAGFNASSNSTLHIKGQLFYSWKIGDTLLYFSFSYWFIKLTQAHLYTLLWIAHSGGLHDLNGII